MQNCCFFPTQFSEQTEKPKPCFFVFQKTTEKPPQTKHYLILTKHVTLWGKISKTTKRKKSEQRSEKWNTDLNVREWQQMRNEAE